MRISIALTLPLLLAACVTVQQAPPIREGPIPSPFEGEQEPELLATEIEGVFKAPSLAPNVYFHASEEDWYRFAYRRWYQAFRWNGNWFILERKPVVLDILESIAI